MEARSFNEETQLVFLGSILPIIAGSFLLGLAALTQRFVPIKAQATRLGSSRILWAPWLPSRVSSFGPSSTAGLVAFWVRNQRASGFSAWSFEPQGLSRGARIGCVSIASVASGGGSGGDAILT